eukprot:Rhum_TRINITY_DN14900_c0_g1::Rhum_TRINITY_DN14900_c0_g1_i2::g.126870::m.126870
MEHIPVLQQLRLRPHELLLREVAVRLQRHEPLKLAGNRGRSLRVGQVRRHGAVERHVTHKTHDHVERPQRLVRRHHVAGVAHNHVLQVLRLRRPAGNLVRAEQLAHRAHNRRAALPDLALSLLEVGGAAPLQGTQELDREGSADDDVELARVQQHLVVVEQRREQVLHRLSHVVDDGNLDVTVVAGPRLVSDVEGSANLRLVEVRRRVHGRVHGAEGVEVVREARHVREVRRLAGQVAVDHEVKAVEGRTPLLRLDVGVDLVHVVLDHLLLVPVHERELLRQVGVRLNHALRVAQTVTNHDTLQRDVRLRALGVLNVHLVRERRHVLSGVALAGDVEVVLLQGREHAVELVDEAVQRRHVVLAVRRQTSLVREGVANTERVVDEDLAVVLVPRDVRLRHLALRGQRDRAHLREQPEQRRAAGSTLQPHRGGGVGLAAAGREVPEERVAVRRRVRRHVARVAQHVRQVREVHTRLLLRLLELARVDERRQDQRLRGGGAGRHGRAHESATHCVGGRCSFNEVQIL